MSHTSFLSYQHQKITSLHYAFCFSQQSTHTYNIHHHSIYILTSSHITINITFIYIMQVHYIIIHSQILVHSLFILHGFIIQNKITTIMSNTYLIFQDYTKGLQERQHILFQDNFFSHNHLYIIDVLSKSYTLVKLEFSSNFS